MENDSQINKQENISTKLEDGRKQAYYTEQVKTIFKR